RRARAPSEALVRVAGCAAGDLVAYPPPWSLFPRPPAPLPSLKFTGYTSSILAASQRREVGKSDGRRCLRSGPRIAGDGGGRGLGHSLRAVRTAVSHVRAP